MLGFTPLASAPLADSGVKNYEVIASDITAGVPVLDTATVAVISNFAPQDITAGVPVVDTAPVFEDETIPAEDITAGAPVVDNANVIVVYNFGADDISTTPVVDSISASIISNFAPQEITSGTPVVDAAAAAIKYILSADDISSTPVVDNATVSVISNFAPVDITAGAPQIDSLPFFQEYALTVVDVVAGAPTLPARFTWDYQEPNVDPWLLDERFPRVEAGSSAYAIFDAMVDAALLRDDNHVALFLTAEAIEGRPLGDITGNGEVRTFDAGQMQSYANGSTIDAEYQAYIEDYMLPYMAARQSDYQAYYDADFDATYTSATAPTDTWTEQVDNSVSWTAVAESVKVWENAA